MELYINDIKADLFSDETVKLTQTIKDIRSLDTVFSDYTQDFSLPASKNNQKIFKYYEKGYVLNSLDNSKRQKAAITMSGFKFKKGYITLKDVKIKDGLPSSYKVQFVGGLSALKKLLKDTKINKLNSLNDGETATLTPEFVAQLLGKTRDADSSALDTKLIYSLISVQPNIYYNDSTFSDDTANLAWNTLNNTHNGLDVYSLKPSLRVNDIIEAIETTYDIEFSNDFFKNTSQEDFNQLFMWLSNDSNYLTDETQAGLKVLYPIDYWTETLPKPSAYDLQANGYLIMYDNDDENLRNIDITMTPSDDSLEYSLGIYNVEAGEYVVQTEPFTGERLISVDDKIVRNTRCKFYLFVEGTNTIEITVHGQIDGGTDWTLDGSITAQRDIPFTITYNMPDIKIFDFLKGLFQMFNLIAYEDEDGVIVVKSFVDYMSEGGEYDITEYVEDSNRSVKGAFKYNEVSLLYQSSKDKQTNSYELQQAKGWGEYKFKNESVESLSNVFNIKVPFAHMKFDRLINQDNGSKVDCQIGLSVDKNESPVDIKTLLYYPIATAFSDGISLRLDGLTEYKLTHFNVPSNTLHLENTTSADSLHFGSEQSTWNSSRRFTDTLYKKYYESYISPLFNKNNRVVSVEAYLPKHILLNFELNDLFIYRNLRYRINSIKTDLTSGKSNIELIGISIIEEADYEVTTVGDAPVITVLGSNPITIAPSTVYVDAGATATDTEDGNLTADIVITTPDIDTTLLGTQLVTYKVTDSDNNISIESRTVINVDTAPPSFADFSFNSRNTSSVTSDYEVIDNGGLYNILFQYKKTVDPDWLDANTIYLLGTSKTSTNIIKGLTSGTSYDFRAIATDVSGNNTTSSSFTQSTA